MEPSGQATGRDPGAGLERTNRCDRHETLADTRRVVPDQVDDHVRGAEVVVEVEAAVAPERGGHVVRQGLCRPEVEVRRRGPRRPRGVEGKEARLGGVDRRDVQDHCCRVVRYGGERTGVEREGLAGAERTAARTYAPTWDAAARLDDPHRGG